jgi:hypothetical protein
MIDEFKTIHISENQISKWSKENSMNNKKIKELFSTIKKLIKQFSNVKVGKFDIQKVITAAKNFIQESYFDKIFKMNSPTSFIDEKLDELYNLEDKNNMNEIKKIKPEYLVAIATSETMNNGIVKRNITFSIDADEKGKEILKQNSIEDSPDNRISIEYLRSMKISEIEKLILEKYETKIAKKLLNSFERWLLLISNHKSKLDPIFSEEKLSLNSEELKVLESEFSGYISKEETNKLLLEIRIICLDFLIKFENPQIHPPFEIDKNTISIGNFKSKINPERMKILKKLGTEKEIISMFLRYNSLLSRGNQWSIPFETYKVLVQKHGVKVEGFASPLNSQIIYFDKKYKFCSLFEDTDKVFGSIGSFFDQNFKNTTVLINPPFSWEMIDKILEFIYKLIDKNKKLEFILFFSSSTSNSKKLETLRYKKLMFQLKENTYFYYDPYNNDKIIKSTFPSQVVVFSNIKNKNYNSMKTDIINSYR